MSLNTEQIKKVIDDKRTIVLSQSQTNSRLYKYLSGNQLIYDTYIVKDPNSLNNAQLSFSSGNLIVDSQGVVLKGTIDISGDVQLNEINANSATFQNQIRILDGGFYVSGNSTFNNSLSIGNLGYIIASKNEFNLGTTQSNDGILNIASNDNTSIINIGCTNDNLKEINIGGGGSGNTKITIGSLGDTIIINATANYISINNLIISDKNIILNAVTGSVPTNPLNTSGSGLLISDGLNNRAGYIITDEETSDHFVLKAPASNYILRTPDLFDESQIIVEEKTNNLTKINNLDVSGNSHFHRGLVSISGIGLLITGSVSFSNSFNVSNVLHIEDNTFSISSNLNANLNIDNLKTQGVINHSGTLNISGVGLIITGDAKVSKNLNVINDAFINNNLVVNKNILVQNNATFNNSNVYINGFLNVSGSSNVSQNLDVNNNVSINNNLFVNKNVNFNDSVVNISGSVNISGNGLVVSGNTRLENLFVEKDVRLNNSTLNISGGLRVNAINNGVIITGNTTFNNSNVNINGKLSVSGIVENNGLITTGNSNIAGNINVISNSITFNTNNISISGPLSHSGDASFYPNIMLNNNIITINNTYSSNFNNYDFQYNFVDISSDNQWVAFSAKAISNSNTQYLGVLIVNTRTNEKSNIVDTDIPLSNNNVVHIKFVKNSIDNNMQQLNLYVINTSTSTYTIYYTTYNVSTNQWNFNLTGSTSGNTSEIPNITSQPLQINNEILVAGINGANNMPYIKQNFEGLYLSGDTYIDRYSKLYLKNENGKIGVIYGEQQILNFTDTRNIFKIETEYTDSLLNIGCEENTKEINIGAGGDNTSKIKNITIGSINDDVKIYGKFTIVNQGGTNTNIQNVNVANARLNVNRPENLGTKLPTLGLGLNLSNGLSDDAGYIITSTYNGDHFVFKAFTGPFSAPNAKAYELYTPVLTTTSVLLSKDTLTKTLIIENIDANGILSVGTLRNYGGLISTGISHFNTINVNNKAFLDTLFLTGDAIFKNKIITQSLIVSGDTTFNGDIKLLGNINVDNAKYTNIEALNSTFNNIYISDNFIVDASSTFNYLNSQTIQSNNLNIVSNATFNNLVSIDGLLNVNGDIISTGNSQFSDMNVQNLIVNNTTFNNSIFISGGIFISGISIITGQMISNEFINISGSIDNLSSNNATFNSNVYINSLLVNSATFNSFLMNIRNPTFNAGLYAQGQVKLENGNLFIDQQSQFTKLVEINQGLSVNSDTTFNAEINIGSIGKISYDNNFYKLNIDNQTDIVGITGEISLGSNDLNKVINVGKGDNSTINIGNDGNTINFKGDINYLGTINANDLTIIASAVLNKQLLLNNGGNVYVLPTDSGIVLCDGQNSQLGYIKTDETQANRYIIKAPTNNFILSTPILTKDSTIIVKDTDNLAIIENILSNNATFNNYVSISGLRVSNNGILNNLQVLLNSTFNNINVLNNATFTNLNVSNGLINNYTATFNNLFVNKLLISGNTTFNSNIFVSGNVDIRNNYSLNVNTINNTSINSNILRITGSINCSGSLNVSGNVIITGGLNSDSIVSKNVSIENLNVSQNVNFQNGLVITGNSTFNSNVFISGSIDISGLTRLSRLNISGNLISTGNSTFNNIVVKNITILDNLNINANLSYTGGLNISGLNITNNIYINGTGYIRNSEILTLDSLKNFGAFVNLLTLDGKTKTFNSLTGNQIFLVNNSIINLVEGITGAPNTNNGFGFFNSIAIDNNLVYVGGSFTNIGGTPIRGLAYWNSDNSQWGNLGNINGIVNSIAIDKDKSIYIGGSFNNVNGLNANSIAVYKSGNWEKLGGGITGIVNSIAINNNEVYVGGTFIGVSGLDIRGLAKWNSTNKQWSSIGNIQGTIETIALNNSNIMYIGGSFIGVSGNSINSIAKRNNNTQTWSNLNGNINGRVKSIIVNKSNEVYIAGSFNSDNGKSFVKYNENLNSLSNLGNGMSGTINNIVFDTIQENIYIGGVNLNEPKNAMYYWNTNENSLNLLDFSGNNEINGNINQLAFDYKNNLYLVGSNLLGISDLEPSTITNFLKFTSNLSKKIIFNNNINFLDNTNKLQATNNFGLNNIGEQINIYFNDDLNNGYLLNKTITGAGGSDIPLDFNQPVTFNNNVKIFGKLSVDDEVIFASNTTINGNLNIDTINTNQINLLDTISINGVNGLIVSNNGYIQNLSSNAIISQNINSLTLNITSNSNFNGDVFMNKNANVNFNLGVNNNINVLNKIGFNTATPQYALDAPDIYDFARFANGNTRGRIVGLYTNISPFPSDTFISSNYNPRANIGNRIDSNVYSTSALRLTTDQSNDGNAIEFLTGIVNTEPDTKMVISKTGNVGIGKTSPNYKLDVNGAINLEGQNLGENIDSQVDLSNKTNVYLRFGESETLSDFAYFRQIGSLNSFGLGLDFHDNGNDSNFYIRDVLSTQTTPDIINTRFAVLGNGNVSIGATTGDGRLNIFRNSGASTNGELYMTDKLQWTMINSNAGIGNWNSLTSTGDHQIIFSDGTSGSGNLVIGPWSATANGIKIMSNGNVGIGKSSPFTKLDVNGAINLEGENLTIDAGVDAENKTNTYIRFGFAGSNNDWAYLRQIGGPDNFKLSLDFHDNGTDSNFYIRDILSAVPGADTITTRFSVLNNGNIGINTDTPESAIDIRGNSSTDNNKLISVGTNFNNTTANNLYGGIRFMNFNNSQEMGSIRCYNSDGGAGNHGDLRFYTRRQFDSQPGDQYYERMRINRFGLVGIGTNTPIAMLDINTTNEVSPFYRSTINITRPVQDSSIYTIGFNNAEGNSFCGMGIVGTGRGVLAPTNYCFLTHIKNTSEWGIRSDGWDPLISVRGGSGNVYIKGNVGIGTTNPQTKLHVIGKTTLQDTNTLLSWVSVGKHVEVGTDSANVAYIDFHSNDSGNTDYDSRIISEGGGSGNLGATLRLWANLIKLEANLIQRSGNTTSFDGPSDIRVKDNVQIANYQLCYENMKKIDLKRFKWNEQKYPKMQDRNVLGWIAQEVEEIFPKSITTTSHKFEDGSEIEDFKSINIDEINKMMYGAVKKLQADNDNYKLKYEELDNKVFTLENTIKQQQETINKLLSFIGTKFSDFSRFPTEWEIAGDLASYAKSSM